MLKTIRASIAFSLVTFVLTGIIYPCFVTVLAQTLFPAQANGSLTADLSGVIAGSELIAQKFSRNAYFHPRPSAAGKEGFDPLFSGGSNLGPTSKILLERITNAIDVLKKENPRAVGSIPVELVTTSASGLDPHLSPAGVEWQIPRVAESRGVAPDRVRQVVDTCLEKPDFGFLGEPRINVLLLNLALDRRFGTPSRQN